MFQTDQPTAVSSLPTPAAAGTQGYFTNGNPATGTPATILDADFMNMVMMELLNIVTAGGLTPSKTTNNQVITAIKTLMQQSAPTIAVDTGTANTYVIAFTPAWSAPVPWAPFWFKVKTTNTGPSTLNADGTARQFVGGAHSAFQGGELIANGNALAYWNPTLNSGAGQYVLVFCSGAPEQVGAATQSQHAVQLGQITSGSVLTTPAAGDNSTKPATTAFADQVGGVVGSVRNLKISVTAASASATLTADEIIVETALGGAPIRLGSFNKTINLATTGAGGMDTGSAPVSGYVALYAIYNPTTQTAALLATNAATLQGSIYGGGNMPAGYTASALISVWATNGSGQFKVGLQRDRQIAIVNSTILSTSTTQASATSLSISGTVPVNAVSVSGTVSLSSTTSSTLSCNISSDTNTLATQTFSVGASSGTVNFSLPIGTAQTIYYAWSNSAGTPTLSMTLSSYSI